MIGVCVEHALASCVTILLIICRLDPHTHRPSSPCRAGETELRRNNTAIRIVVVDKFFLGCVSRSRFNFWFRQWMTTLSLPRVPMIGNCARTWEQRSLCRRLLWSKNNLQGENLFSLLGHINRINLEYVIPVLNYYIFWGNRKRRSILIHWPPSGGSEKDRFTARPILFIVVLFLKNSFWSKF